MLGSVSPEIQALSRLAACDVRSNLESNLKHIKREIGLSPWIYWGSRLKYELSIANRNPVPTEDDWRIGLAQKLLIQRQLEFTMDMNKMKNLKI